MLCLANEISSWENRRAPEPIFCSVGENGFENFLPMLCRLRLAPIISNILLYSLVFIILVPQHLGPVMMSYIPKKSNYIWNMKIALTEKKVLALHVSLKMLTWFLKNHVVKYYIHLYNFYIVCTTTWYWYVYAMLHAYYLFSCTCGCTYVQPIYVSTYEHPYNFVFMTSKQT